MPHSYDNFDNTKSQNQYPNHDPRGFTKSRKVHFSKVQTLDNASKIILFRGFFVKIIILKLWHITLD